MTESAAPLRVMEKRLRTGGLFSTIRLSTLQTGRCSKLCKTCSHA